MYTLPFPSFPNPAAMTRRLALGALLATSMAPAMAQDTWPSKSVKFVTWSNPGGNLDIVSRIMGDIASRKWGQSVITEGRIGVTGVIATDYVAKSPADGYTLLVTSNTGHLTNTFTRKKLPFDPVKDFEPVSLLVSGNIGVLVSANAPYNNLAELVAHAKKTGKPVSFGTPGPGTSAHLYGVALGTQGGIEMNHVPYKGGELGAVNDVIGGVLDLTLVSSGNVKAQIQGGRLKALAMSGPERTKAIPDVPTFEEQGFKNVGVAGWIALYAPAGTPPAVIKKIEASMSEALAQPEVAQRLESLGYDVMSGKAEDLRNLYKSDTQRFATLVKNAGISPE